MSPNPALSDLTEEEAEDFGAEIVSVVKSYVDRVIRPLEMKITRLEAMIEHCPLMALSGHSNLSPFYSITSSARESSDGGMVRPSAFAVLRLITSSNLVGCSTGRSAGFVPLRIRST